MGVMRVEAIQPEFDPFEKDNLEREGYFSDLKAAEEMKNQAGYKTSECPLCGKRLFGFLMSRHLMYEDDVARPDQYDIMKTIEDGNKPGFNLFGDKIEEVIEDE
jgi:hypothetical protein